MFVAVLLSLVLLRRSFLAAGTGVLPELTCAVLGAGSRGLLSEVSELISGRNRSLGSASSSTSQTDTNGVIGALQLDPSRFQNFSWLEVKVRYDQDTTQCMMLFTLVLRCSYRRNMAMTARLQRNFDSLVQRRFGAKLQTSGIIHSWPMQDAHFSST